MTNIKVKDIPHLDNIEFNFISPLELDPNEPFPDKEFDDGEISLAEIGASANKKFSFENGNKKIEFGAKGEGHSALGVYRNTDKLYASLKRKGLSEPFAKLTNLKIADDENLIALHWGYILEASAKGQIALIPAAIPLKLTFGAKGQKAGISVLLHSRKRDEKIQKSLKETLKSWRMPRQVKSIDNLEPKTTVLFETMGKLDLSLGVQYGYDFNWSKEQVSLGQLSGDVGLKIEMGVKATLGFQTAGRYAIALRRDSDAEEIRMQVFRMKQKGWSFALDANLSSQFNSDLIPDDADEFIKGVLNLNGLQIIKDFEKWFDADAKLEDLLGKELEEYAEKFIRKVTGIDPTEAIEIGMKRFKEFIERWKNLPHELTSMVYGQFDKIGNLNDLKTFLKKVIDFADDSDKIANEITKQVEDLDFHNLPVGKWLAAASESGIMTLLANVDTEREKLVDKAKETLAILDGSEVEKTLKELQKWINEKINLKKIEDLKPDEWLKKRLRDFLADNKEYQLVMDDLKKVRSAIIDIRKKYADFYEKGYKALMEKYNFEFNYKYQQSTSKDALIDLTFDFAGNKKLDAETCLAEAMDGQFTRLFTEKLDCIKINQAVFTHEIKRNVHIGVNLPYFKRTLDHLTESLAKGTIADTEEGRLWVFNLKGKQLVKKSKAISKLSIEAELTESAETRKFSKESYKTNYKFIYHRKNAKRELLEARYKFASDEYLRPVLPSYSNYLTELDKYLDDNDIPGSNKLGNVLTSMEVSLPSEVISVWKDIPKKYDDNFYTNMSIKIQQRFREWIPRVYLQKLKRYGQTTNVYPLLVYSALPPLVKRREEGVYHWKYNSDIDKAKVFDTYCVTNLVKENGVLEQHRNLMPDKYLKNYKNSKLGKMKNSIIGQGAFGFRMLCSMERNIIHDSVETIKTLHKFLAETDIEKRLKYLAKFGAEFTDTFNDDIGGIDYIPKGALRPLGLILISDISSLIKSEIQKLKMATMLEFAVVKPKVDFDKAVENFRKGDFPKKEDLIVQHRMVNVNEIRVE